MGNDNGGTSPRNPALGGSVSAAEFRRRALEAGVDPWDPEQLEAMTRDERFPNPNDVLAATEHELVVVVQQRSSISQKPKARRTLVALGLRRIGDSRVHRVHPSLKGMVRNVDHLVRVAPVGPSHAVSKPGVRRSVDTKPRSGTGGHAPATEEVPMSVSQYKTLAGDSAMFVGLDDENWVSVEPVGRYVTVTWTTNLRAAGAVRALEPFLVRPKAAVVYDADAARSVDPDELLLVVQKLSPTALRLDGDDWSVTWQSLPGPRRAETSYMAERVTDGLLRKLLTTTATKTVTGALDDVVGQLASHLSPQ